MDKRFSEQSDILIAAGLQKCLLFPGDAGYEESIGSYWSVNAQQHPWCIIQPTSTDEVSHTLKALSSNEHEASDWGFAVRSGGHSHWAGSNNIDNGITIDLQLLNSVTYDATTRLASLGPGNRWGRVFEILDGFGVVVPGGRVADVGVAGFLTGGGNSYYSGRAGMACDSVVNFEVVLADGRIVQANKDTNADLWRALKGGSANFGIVTRFDMETLPASSVWGGMQASDKSTTQDFITSVINFTNENHKNPQDAYLVNFTYNPTIFPVIVVSSVMVDTLGVENAPAFDEIQKIPTVMQDIKHRTMKEITTAYVLPSGTRNIWFTLTFLNNASIAQKTADLHEKLVSDLKEVLPAKDFTTQCILQPMPSHLAQIGVAKGGNVLGMDATKKNSLLWLGAIAFQSTEHEPFVQAKMAAWSADIEAYASSLGADVPWRYLNYADPSQDPLSSYGTQNVDFVRQVAEKYDPKGLFQKRMPGGFRISRV